MSLYLALLSIAITDGTVMDSGLRCWVSPRNKHPYSGDMRCMYSHNAPELVGFQLEDR